MIILNKMSGRILIILAMVAAATPALGSLMAQHSVLDLDAAIQEALSQNPDWVTAQNGATRASWKRMEVLAGHLPHVSIHGNHIFNAKYEMLNVNWMGSSLVFPEGFPQTSVSLQVSLLVFDGLSTYHRYQASILQDEAAHLELAYQRFELEQKVRYQFYQVMTAQLLIAVADENLKSLEDHLSLAQALSSSGYSTRFDTLRVEAQLEEAKVEQLLAVDTLVLAQRRLSEVMGVEHGERTLVGSLPVPDFTGGFETGTTVDRMARSDFEAQKKREGASHRLALASRTFWMPQISLFGQNGWYRFGNFNPIILPNATFQMAYSFGLQLIWNLWDGGASFAQAKMAETLHHDHQNTTRATGLKLVDEFETWKRRLVYQTALYRARQRTLKKSEESVRLARTGVQAGTQTHTDYLDAELDWFRSKAGLIRAQADAAEAQIRIELAIGRRL